MPGFMKIDYSDQIRKEQKIGGGGCAAIYKGVILDNSLKEVSFFFVFSLFLSLFLFFGKKNNSKIIKINESKNIEIWM